MFNSDYLNLMQVMQIDCYTPRVQPPYAKFEQITKINIQQTASLLTTKTQEKIKEKTAANNLTKNNLAHPISHQELPKIGTAQTNKLSTVQEPQVKTSKVTNVHIPNFNLQLIRTENYLILADLPQRKSLPQLVNLHLLLQAILRSSNLDANYQIIGDVLFWPLFKSNVIVQDSARATEYIHEVIANHSKNKKYTNLWLMGENANTFAGDLTNTLVLPSLHQIATNPNYKRTAWQQIKQFINN